MHISYVLVKRKIKKDKLLPVVLKAEMGMTDTAVKMTNPNLLVCHTKQPPTSLLLKLIKKEHLKYVSFSLTVFPLNFHENWSAELQCNISQSRAAEVSLVLVTSI